jgi:hypothetical protein
LIGQQYGQKKRLGNYFLFWCCLYQTIAFVGSFITREGIKIENGFIKRFLFKKKLLGKPMYRKEESTRRTDLISKVGLASIGWMITYSRIS